ncbi:MAG: hypothetical protein WCP21_23890, partial [Armatimonadota bacterium]
TKLGAALALTLVLLALALFVFSALLFSGYTCDDSYITFRYASNAAAGQGLVFNPGERVEGYSNPLWVFLLVGALKLGLEVVVAAKVLGVLAGMGALLFAFGIVRRLLGQADGWQPLVILALIGPGLAYYSVSGLETSLYCCLLTAAVYCLLLSSVAAQWALSALVLAVALTRPEGLLLAPALLGWRLVCWRQFEGRQKTALVASTVLSLSGLAAFFLWRHSYFGAWLPNTFYAKPPGVFGGDSLLYPLGYLREFLATTGAWVWLAPGLAWLRRKPLAGGALLVTLLVEVALVFHAHGDWMVLSRFLLPVLPLLTAFGYAALLHWKAPRSLLLSLLGLALALNAVQIAEQLRDFREGQYPQSVMAGLRQQVAGEWLRQHFPPTTVIAAKRIGGLSYYSGMRMVDMLGLVDRPIAMIRHGSQTRGKGEQGLMAAEVFRRQPDVILLCVMKRWDHVPRNEPAPDLANNLRDVDNAIYAGLGKHGYRFLYRLPQGATGEFAVYARAGVRPSPPL